MKKPSSVSMCVCTRAHASMLVYAWQVPIEAPRDLGSKASGSCLTQVLGTIFGFSGTAGKSLNL